MGIALLCVCCGGSSHGSETKPDVSAFEGVWRTQRNTGTDSCAGDFDTDNGPGFDIRLRAGSTSALEYLWLDSQDPKKASCIETFDVNGDEAVLQGTQSCSFRSIVDVDEDGNPVQGLHVVEFVDVHLTVSDDTLEETAESHYKLDLTGEQCESNYHVTYERH
ncbi:MAG TPA: hypothetical protein VHB79_29600 [Polyangiaceae bacterium]|nr:hypothetical protein [Polyangiaceae bacterium]